jgi:predicted nucleic acid-binding protein
MTLVDTSVWVDHLNNADPGLQKMLNAGRVLIHPFVIGEIACGSLRSRRQTLGLLAALPQVSVASHSEVLYLLESHRLGGAGIGWVDAHLLAAVKISGLAKIWTRDRALRGAARSLKISA